MFPKYREVESVVLYGSRAKGNYKPFSDIDITLKGAALTRELLGKIFTEIDDLLLPYFLDISIYDKLTDKEFLVFRIFSRLCHNNDSRSTSPRRPMSIVVDLVK